MNAKLRTWAVIFQVEDGRVFHETSESLGIPSDTIFCEHTAYNFAQAANRLHATHITNNNLGKYPSRSQWIVTYWVAALRPHIEAQPDHAPDIVIGQLASEVAHNKGGEATLSITPVANTPRWVTKIPKAQSPRNSKKRALPEEDLGEDSDDEDFDGLARSPAKSVAFTFRIDEEAKVEQFLYARACQVQQHVLRTLGKAWIKAVCPKKQHKYSYISSNPKLRSQRNKKRRPVYDKGPPRIPPFWPSLGMCPHREPDHIDRHRGSYLILCQPFDETDLVCRAYVPYCPSTTSPLGCGGVHEAKRHEALRSAAIVKGQLGEVPGRSFPFE